MTGRIFDVKRFAIHDGPGIRTTVFLKGCPMACRWCHNPEGMRPDREMIVHHERCVRCGACAAACPTGAVRPGAFVDRVQCALCGACEEACPTRAIRRAWRDVTDDELVEELLRDEVFFNLGGGVTLSGGEPMMQAEFTLSMLEKLKARGIDTCVETGMMAPFDVIRALCGAADRLLADLKLMDDAAHRHYTGVSNEAVLENFRYIARNAPDVTVRVPLIPGVTATEENLSAIARFVRVCNPAIPVELINFNSLAASKYAMLGQTYFDEDMRALPAEEFERLKRLVSAAWVGGPL